jgi:hypothetical protein
MTGITSQSPSRAARPTYVGIGAQKCASTWLHRILAEHPDIAVPAAKEIDFFSWHYDRGYQWYERCFATDDAVARQRGEISPSYFCEPSVPARVARYAPDVKILLSLRDPVQRALSNHRHEVREGHLVGPDLSFEAGLANNPMYVEQGRYATHLRRWLQYFPREQLLVVLMDDVEQRPNEVCRTVYRFLGVDEAFVPAGLQQRYNRSYASRSRWLTVVKDRVYGATRAPGLRWAWGAAAGLGLRSAYRRVNEVPSEAVIPAPHPDTLAQLRRLFEPELRELETLLGRSFEAWRTDRQVPVKAVA